MSYSLKHIFIIALCGLFFSTCKNGKNGHNGKEDRFNMQPSKSKPLSIQKENIFSYDSLAYLNANNTIKKQIRGTWILDSILIDNKKTNTELILNGNKIEELDFDPNFIVSSSRKVRSWSEVYNLGVYVIDEKNLKLMDVGGTEIGLFQIEQSTAKQLILSKNKKLYYFSLDLKVEQANRVRFGPGYK